MEREENRDTKARETERSGAERRKFLGLPCFDQTQVLVKTRKTLNLDIAGCCQLSEVHQAKIACRGSSRSAPTNLAVSDTPTMSSGQFSGWQGQVCST